LRRPFLTAVVLAEAEIAKCSSFFPDLSAAVSQRGFNPRPAHVSLGLSGLRYFGAILPPARVRRPPPVPKRVSFANSDSSVRRCSAALLARAACTRLRRPINLSTGIAFRFICDSPSPLHAVL